MKKIFFFLLSTIIFFSISTKVLAAQTLNLMAFNYAFNMYGSTWDRIIAQYIVAHNLDAVVFPEVNCDRIDKIVRYLVEYGYPIDNNHRDRYYKCVTFGNCGGQAVFSKYGFQDYKWQTFNTCTDCTDYNPLIQVVSINHPAGKIWLIGHHAGIRPVEACRDPMNRKVLEFMRTKLAAYFPNYQGEPVFALGDFNETPDGPQMREILNNIGYNSACPRVQPYNDFSLNCNNTVRKEGAWRNVIDYVLYPDNSHWQLQSGYVVRDGPLSGASDHYAVVGKFTYQSTPAYCQYDYDLSKTINVGDIQYLLANWQGAQSLSILMALIQNWGAVCD